MSSGHAGDERPTVRDLILRGEKQAGLALGHEDHLWTRHAYAAGCSQRARWLLEQRPGEAPFHVGLLARNTADHALWLGACAVAGAVAVGLNPTRTPEELARDAAHTAVALVLVDPALAEKATAITGVSVRTLDDPALAEEVRQHRQDAPKVEVGPDDLFMLVFTSGTTSDPKAVKCSHGRFAHSGSMVALMNELGPDDVVLCTMPLFHSNAVIAGWLAGLAAGALVLVRDFSARGFVEDLRTSGVTYANYVGKPLSYVLAVPQAPGDDQVPLRAVFGNEASEDTIQAFAARFDCRVMDAYGSTEGGISLLRTDQTPRGALGVGIGDIRVLAPDGRECPPAMLDVDGNVVNADEAIGELVNVDGTGGFEGYWDNPDADRERIRDGHFHSGDLAWRDADGFFWFAGRTGDWVRVDGENLAVAPIERVLADHPEVRDAIVTAVPDPVGGDQILAWLEVDDPAGMEPGELGAWLAGRADLAARARPMWVRLETALPRTPTNKAKRNELRQLGLAEAQHLLHRPARSDTFTHGTPR